MDSPTQSDNSTMGAKERSTETEKTKQKGKKLDPRVYMLVSLLTIVVGGVLFLLYATVPSENDVQRTFYLVLASAILPAGILWTLQHYVLQKPIEDDYVSLLERYKEENNSLLTQYKKDGQYLLSECRRRWNLWGTLQSCEQHHFRAISDERATLVKRVLEESLGDEACSEIIIIGSTLNGLFCQRSWFENFILEALKKRKTLKLMFTHWDHVTHREKQEDRADGDIAQELKRSLVQADKWKVPSKAIRLVHGAPTVFMVIAGDNMILNPYPFGGESVTSMSVWLTNPEPSRPEGLPGTIWHAYYINHYDMVWHPEKYPRRLCTAKNPISSELPDQWEDEIEKFIDDVREEATKTRKAQA